MAGAGTKSLATFLRVGPKYTEFLREIHFHCITLSAEECEDPASYGNITRAIDELTGQDRYKDQIRSWSNIGVGIYLDQLPNNVRGPTDKPANELKGWTAPDTSSSWKLAASSAPSATYSATVAVLATIAVLALTQL